MNSSYSIIYSFIAIDIVWLQSPAASLCMAQIPGSKGRGSTGKVKWNRVMVIIIISELYLFIKLYVLRINSFIVVKYINVF